jgi:periplasmic protein CpxP/Spy
LDRIARNLAQLSCSFSGVRAVNEGEHVMFYTDRSPFSSEPSSSRPVYGIRESGVRTRSFFGAAIVACGFVFCAGCFVAAASGMEHLGFAPGAQIAVLQFAIARTLDSVGASSTQEAKAHDIVAAKLAKVVSELEEFQLLRERAIGIVAAPSFDRDAIEKLRSESIARLDAESKLAVAGLADIVDLLDPGQRAQLAARLESGRPMGARPPGGPDFGSDKD